MFPSHDRSVLDEAKRQMDKMVSYAQDQGVEVRTDYYDDVLRQKQKDLELAQELYDDGLIDEYRLEKAKLDAKYAGIAVDSARDRERFYGLPEGSISGDWKSSTRAANNRVVNVPRTPNLRNWFTMAEEMEHQFNQLPDPSFDRPDQVAYRYEEEKRAKQDALNRIGGYMTPAVQDFAAFTMDSYRDAFADDIAFEEVLRRKGQQLANAPLAATSNNWNDFLPEEYINEERAYDYWNKQNTSPYNYFVQNYPEIRNYGLFGDENYFNRIANAMYEDIYNPPEEEWSWEDDVNTKDKAVPINSPMLR